MRTEQETEDATSAEVHADAAATAVGGRRGVTTARRRTWQRAAVVDALDKLDGFVSAQRLHAQMDSAGARVGLATVYRALQTLVDDGDVDLVRSPDGEALYRRCSSSHHHHLTCTRCGHTVEIDGSDAEEWVRQVAANYGFSDVDHVIELTGLCSACRAATADAPARDRSSSTSRS